MKRIGFGPIIGFIFFVIPLLVLAYPQPPTGNTGAPGDGNCTGCHSGVSTGGSVSVTFPSGLSYSPGVKQHLTVTVNDSLHSAWSFQLSARLTSNTSSQAGSFTATDVVNTTVQSSGTVQDMETTSSGINMSSWSFDWTPPSTNVGNVNIYVTGLAAGSPGGTTSGNGIYNASYVLAAPPATKPALSLSPTTLSFTTQQGGATPASQSISVSSGGTPVPYTVATSGGTWLSASLTGGTTTGMFSVSANPTGLTSGTYNGTVTISSAGTSNSPQTVPVSFTITPAASQTLSVSPTSMSFAYQTGGSAPVAQSITVSSSGTGLSYTTAASGGTWLSASSTSGSTPGTVSVSTNPGGLAAGTYNGTVTITANGATGSPQTVSVALVVTAAPTPTLSASPASLSFAYQTGAATPASQAINISSSGAAFNFTAAASNVPWLSATPTGGPTPGSVNVSVNPNGLAAGTYGGTVTITAAGAAGSPRVVPVSLTVTSATVSTLNTTPASLTFTYQTGGSTPGTQSIAVSSSGTGLSYTAAASGGTWLSASPTSGTTPGTVSVSVNPAGLAIGTHNGMVTITSNGAAGSPQSVAVTLIVSNTGNSSFLTVTPNALQFSTQTGITSSVFAAQKLTITTTGSSAIAYQSSATTQTGGNWLMLSSTHGSTPGTLVVSVNATNLAAGTFQGSITITPGGSLSPQTVPVTLVVGSSSTSSTLRAYPGRLGFLYPNASGDGGTKNLRVISSGKPLSFSASAFGGDWLTVNPTSGTTPSTLTVSVNAHGLPRGTYSGMIMLTSGTKKTSVAVRLSVAPVDGGDDGGESESNLTVVPTTNDPTDSGTVGAELLDAAGVPVPMATANSSINQGLVLSKTANAPAGTTAGALIVPAESLTTLTQLGFDVRQGGHCTATAPHFVVVTSDEVTHVVTGCANGTIQPAPAAGWMRVRFDLTNPAQANPTIAPDQAIKSIAIVLDEGPEASPNVGGGLVVIDNISVNGVLVGKD
jgi:hypothetical protein